MAILETQVMWLKESDFPQGADQQLEVREYREVPGKRGKDKELIVTLPSGEYRCVTIWGDNLNRLIQILGNNTGSWQGKTITMGVKRIDGKLMRIVR